MLVIVGGTDIFIIVVVVSVPSAGEVRRKQVGEGARRGGIVGVIIVVESFNSAPGPGKVFLLIPIHSQAYTVAAELIFFP